MQFRHTDLSSLAGHNECKEYRALRASHTIINTCRHIINRLTSMQCELNCTVNMSDMLGVNEEPHVNGLPYVSKLLRFCLFADDSSIYFDSDNLRTLQQDIRKVRKWLEANRLALNISKTNYVIFHSPAKKLNEFVRIKLGFKLINCVQSVKYFGILVDAAFSWKPQITELSKKLAWTTGIFCNIRH